MKGEVGGFPAYVRDGPCNNLVNKHSPFTIRTPDITLNMVLAMVKVILLGFSRLKMGRRNSNTLRSRGFR